MPASSNPLPPLSLSISPPYPNTARRRTHQERPIPISNTSIRPRPLIQTPEQSATNRTPKHSPQPPHKENKRIHGRILPDTEDFGDERREQRIVTAGGDAVENYESQPQ